MVMKLLLLTLMLWVGTSHVEAKEKTDGDAPTDSVTTAASPVYISLLTCSPGTEPYTLFGHTAIHIRCDTLRGFDYVFNYGLFNYSSDNFILRFVKGETDYELGAEPTDFFMSRYVDEGHTVWEQELNLTADEKERLFGLIMWNARPENKTYRYNFLYDNCTTRAREALKRALDEVRVAYPRNEERLTFRDIIHQYTARSPWVEFGIDLVLGCEIDGVLSERDKMFVPLRYHDLVAGARLEQEDGESKPLMKEETVYEPVVPLVDAPAWPFTPMQVMSLLLLLTVVVTFVDWRRKKVSWWLDIALVGVQGVAGLLVAFLFFLSEHPAVGTNWLIVLVNPLAFVLMVSWMKLPCFRSGLRRSFEYVNLAAITFTLLLFVLPLQQLPWALLPLVLSLLLRGIVRITIGLNVPQKNTEKSQTTRKIPMVSVCFSVFPLLIMHL